MKKLIIAFAIVYATAMSHAATVKWQASAASVYNGKNMYLLTAIAPTYDTLEKFEAAAVDVGTVTKAAAVYKVPNRSASNVAITKTADFYLAVVDGNTIHYLNVTDTFQSKVYEGSDSSPGTATADFATVLGSDTTATIGGDPGPAPEPTSGLLLIFGVAGLALRRRRA